jgi:hypothetical protein
MLWTFQNLKNYNYFKIPFEHSKWICKKYIFCDFLIWFITSWFEIGNGKKCYFQYHLKIHILSEFSTTLGKDFEKGL